MVQDYIFIHPHYQVLDKICVSEYDIIFRSTIRLDRYKDLLVIKSPGINSRGYTLDKIVISRIRMNLKLTESFDIHSSFIKVLRSRKFDETDISRYSVTPIYKYCLKSCHF